METSIAATNPAYQGHRRLIAATLFACCAVLALTAPPAAAATDKITSSTLLTLSTPSQQISEAALLDVGIPTLNDGLYLTDENDTVFPEVRYAEAIYFSQSASQGDGKKWRLGRYSRYPDRQRNYGSVYHWHHTAVRWRNHGSGYTGQR